MTSLTPEAQRLALRDMFETFPLRLADAVRDADARLELGGALPDGEWGTAEVVRHLIAVDREVWAPRLEQVEEQDEPRWAWVEPGLDEGSAGRPLETLLYTFTTGRDAIVERLDGLDETGWARAGIHATYGRLDVPALLLKAIEHDEEHLGQVARIGSA